MPDLQRPRELKKTTFDQHKPSCKRATGDYLFKTGKKAGQLAVNSAKGRK